MAARNAGLAEDRAIRLRIGLNLGDVIIEGDDVFGDGVNVAARLEGIAPPGRVAVSGTVRDHLGNRLDIQFEDMGEQKLKNIAGPVRVFRIAEEKEPRGSSLFGREFREHALDCRSALRQYERNPRAGLHRRRHSGEYHYRAVAVPRPCGDRPQLKFYLQRQGDARSGYPPGSGRQLHTGRQHAAYGLQCKG
jgi:hypothetical protein